jgi:hypothetical protein
VTGFKQGKRKEIPGVEIWFLKKQVSLQRPVEGIYRSNLKCVHQEKLE